MPKKLKITSRKKTPWDKKVDLEPIEQFIKDKYIDSYNYKHPDLTDTNEAALLNSYELDSCQFCGSTRIQKRGYTKNGLQRYYCTNCKKSFTVLSNTLFNDHKISLTEWIEFCLDIFRFESTNVASKTNKNAYTTSKYWLKKLFIILENIQDDLVLQGDSIQIDETYYKVSKGDTKYKNGKQLRGLSRNQYCIGIGYDGKNVYAKVEGFGKTSSIKTKETFINHIQKGSHIIHDKEKSHKILVKELNLTEEVYDSKEIKKLEGEKNPLYEINQKCFMLKKFLDSHSGFNREDIQDYINLFCFIQNPPTEKLEKVKIILDSAIRGARTLKYRDAFKKSNGK